jgi:putative methionine-R-sulfoxide reductase with GAF domain
LTADFLVPQLHYNKAFLDATKSKDRVLRLNQEVTTGPTRLTLSEESFQQLLEAAFVIQEHNDRAARPLQHSDSHHVLSEIIEAQRLIHSGQLELQPATQLVVDRVRKVTAANWAAAAFVQENELHYRVTSSGVNGFRIESARTDSCPSAECLRSSHSLLQDDLSMKHGFENYRAHGIQSLIAVPFFAEGKAAGILEVGFANAHAFAQKDVNTCELLASLITEAMSRAAELEWKRALAAERATMLETLERIKPQLERLAEPLAAEATALTEEQSAEIAETIEIPRVECLLCRGCGKQLTGEESFCGSCGLPTPNRKPTGDIQSKWASLWQMQQAAEKERLGKTQGQEPTDALALPHDSALMILKQISEGIIPDWGSEQEEAALQLKNENEIRILPDDLVPPASPRSPWTSAAHARQWLESLTPHSDKRVWLAKTWRRQRANIYLGTAILLLITVIAGWNSIGPQSHTDPGRPKLSLFEKALIALNLAEPPPAPVYSGNPKTQVWVDLHTALYYCPGEDLYGKTDGGKMTTQRDAQQDQFQPALRKPCN